MWSLPHTERVGVSQKSCDTAIRPDLAVLIQAVFSLTLVGIYPNPGIWLLFKRFSLGLVFCFVLGTDTGRFARLRGVTVVNRYKSICRLQCYSLIN